MLGIVVRMYGTKGGRYYYYSPVLLPYSYAEDGTKVKERRLPPAGGRSRTRRRRYETGRAASILAVGDTSAVAASVDALLFLRTVVSSPFPDEYR